MSGPYASSAWVYRRAGWVGVLPLPAGAKWPPPGGYTGWAGVDPSGPDVQAWVDGPTGAGNVALRLPPGVYGLDVDNYGGKTGGAALTRLVDGLGPLPATWTVSSRDDGVSGIRLLRAELPVGRRWRDEPAGHGAGIEAIHLGHRYAVVWPSVHPDTGRKYRWTRPDGTAADGEVPSIDGLPMMPATWVEGLSEPGEVRTGEMAGHHEAVETVAGWREGEPCPRVAHAHARALRGLAAATDGAALHPVSVAGVHELTNLGHEGHAGVRRALAEHYVAHVEVRSGRGDSREAAEGEWWRAVRGAIGKLPAATGRTECDCGLWSGDGLLFTPDDLGAPASGPADDLFLGPAEAVEGDAAATGGSTDVPHPDVHEELWRREVRRRADAIEHARHWVPPRSYGSLADELLLPDTEAQWRIHGLLGAGHNAVLIAGRKAGKTTMVNEFVRAYVDGEPFLGTQEVTRAAGGVAVFNYEVDEAQYRRWLRDVGIRHTERVHVLHLRGRSLPLVNSRVRAWVTAWLRERGVSAWVVDPYSRAYIGSVDNGNDEAKVSAFLDTLDVIKADAGISELVMPVHTPKGRAEEGEETAIGSQRLEAWPDVMWFLTRDGDRRFIRAEGRDVLFRESALQFDESTRRLSVELFGQDRKATRLGANVDKLIRFIRANPECTQNDIIDGLGWNARLVKEAVDAAGDRVVVERGANRARIHILKTDIPGVTQSESHTGLHRVTPPSGGCGVTQPVGGVTPPPPGCDADPGHTTLNPFAFMGGAA